MLRDVMIHAGRISIEDFLYERIKLAEVLFADFVVIELLREEIIREEIISQPRPEILCGFTTSGDVKTGNRRAMVFGLRVTEAEGRRLFGFRQNVRNAVSV